MTVGLASTLAMKHVNGNDICGDMHNVDLWGRMETIQTLKTASILLSRGRPYGGRV